MRERPIESVEARVFRIPTEAPESDGTLCWDATTVLVARARAAGCAGLGYSYTHAGAARVVDETLAPRIRGGDAMSPALAWQRMRQAVRNVGRRGIAASAIAAADVALWDLKARLLEVSLADLLGAVRDEVPVYGSGGFTSYGDDELARQLGGWVEQGIRMVKMKIAPDAERDRARVAVARRAIGPDAELFVDANGGFDRKQALALAESIDDERVSWLEEPVSSDDLAGLRLLRDRVPARMHIAAGEYGFDPVHFHRMLAAEAVDVIQPDITRCQGISGLLEAATLGKVHGVPLSLHTAPALHAHVACSLPGVLHVEWFHDHVRVEKALFEGLPVLVEGALRPDRSVPGHGITLDERVATRYAV